MNLLSESQLQEMVLELSKGSAALGEKVRRQQISLDTLRVAVAFALDREHYERLLETLRNLEKNQVESDSSVETIRSVVAMLDAVKTRNVGQA